MRTYSDDEYTLLKIGVQELWKYTLIISVLSDWTRKGNTIYQSILHRATSS